MARAKPETDVLKAVVNAAAMLIVVVVIIIIFSIIVTRRYADSLHREEMEEPSQR